MLRLHFKDRDQAETFLETVCGNLDIPVHSERAFADPNRDYNPWFIDISVPDIPEEEAENEAYTPPHETQVVLAAHEAFTWGIEVGTGKYAWNHIQQRMTYGGEGPHPIPLQTRVRRIENPEEREQMKNRPLPPFQSVGSVVGSNGSAAIVQFDNTTYPRRPNGSLGDYLFPEELESEDGKHRWLRYGPLGDRVIKICAKCKGEVPMHVSGCELTR